jgi:hypothetical protein
MFSGFKQAWREIRNGRPGRRFQDRYDTKRRSRGGKSWARKFLPPAAGVMLLVAGIIFCFIPGPGLPLVVVGAALLAERVRLLARALDWLEVKLRKVIETGMRWWRQGSGLARMAVILLAALMVAGAGYGAYHFFFDP